MAARPRQLAIGLVLLLAIGGGLRLSAQSARRVISLVPAVTEMLFAIGAGPQVIAVSSYDAFPPEVAALPKVGALIDPNVEAILALRPDLVISYATQTDLHTQLQRGRIETFTYRHAGLDGLFDTLPRLGSAVGRRADAERLVRDMRAQLEGVRTRVRGRLRPRTMLVFGRDAGTLRGVFASGGRGFLHEMLEIAGGTNVFADVARESVQPSVETMLARAPDVILEVHSSRTLSAQSAARERAAWAALASIPAVRLGRIHFLDGNYLLVPGPRVGLATNAFARALHPDAFR